MQVTVRLFALARERTGRAVVAVEVSDPATVADLKSALARSFPVLAPLLPNLRIALNAEYVADHCLIPAGAEMAVIPPVSGGSLPTRPTRKATDDRDHRRTD